MIIDDGDNSSTIGYSDNNQLAQDLSKFWDTEAIGVIDCKQQLLDQFPPEIVLDWANRRYQVTLPWKSDIRPLSDCYFLCVGRLNQLYKRLTRCELILKEYDGVFQKQFDDGIIERVPQSKEGLRGHFLPHHGVIREDKETTKLRVVFDGSAKDGLKDLSLNDCLEKGPNTTPHIFDILLKSRAYPISIVADVEKAFHQIVVAPKDRNMLKLMILAGKTLR